MIYNGITSTNNKELANLFSDFFNSINKNSNAYKPNVHLGIYDSISMSKKAFSPSEIIECIKALPNKFSAGPDGTLPFL